MDGDANDRDQCIADAATTIFTTTAEGTVKRCGVVTGDDLTSLLAAAKDANAHPVDQRRDRVPPDPPTPAPRRARVLGSCAPVPAGRRLCRRPDAGPTLEPSTGREGGMMFSDSRLRRTAIWAAAAAMLSLVSAGSARATMQDRLAPLEHRARLEGRARRRAWPGPSP
jgi:hypothetical protein